MKKPISYRPFCLISSKMLKPRFCLNADWPKQLTFYVLLASGTFIIFFNLLLGYKPFSPAEIVFIYILPWLMLWSFLYLDVVLSKQNRIIILTIIIIIILGIINVLISDDFYQSAKWMAIFLLSGIIPLWASMFLITENSSLQLFSYFSFGWLFIFTCIEIGNYLLINKYNFVLIDHPIPIGTLVFLLSVGPLLVMFSDQNKLKISSIILIIMGLILVVITNKRGAFVAIFGMVLTWIYYRYIRKPFYVYVFLLTVLVNFIIGWHYYKTLDKNIPIYNSILHRMELYPFALHIYLKHPFFGTGLRALSHENYLNDYTLHNKSLDTFHSTVVSLQTFDNMILTGLVELGTIMTLCYLGLISIIIYRYCRKTRPFSLDHQKEFILLLPLFGLALHALTYDALVFPPINWLFHVQLGILAGYSKG